MNIILLGSTTKKTLLKWQWMVEGKPNIEKRPYSVRIWALKHWGPGSDWVGIQTLRPQPRIQESSMRNSEDVSRCPSGPSALLMTLHYK